MARSSGDVGMSKSLPVTPSTDRCFDQIAESLRAERERADEFLTIHEERLARAEGAVEDLLRRLEDSARGVSAADGREDDESAEDFRRRYEMAMEDLHELKASNSLLQEQLSKARSTASNLAKQGRGQEKCLDWEAEKLRILASLESDFDGADPKQQAERLRIEEVIETTDSAIALKDEQIRELQRQFDALDVAKLSAAERQSAVAQTIDGDAVIKEERQRLRQLQEEYQAKMRQEEIAISLERAKLARERAELEERLRSAENLVSKASALTSVMENVERPARGRWMNRLGLSDSDRERGKHS
jgi:hypothetical protein